MKYYFIYFCIVMELFALLTDDYKKAFKNKEWEKKMLLSMVLSQIKNKKIDLWRDLEDDEILSIIKKEAKSIKETMSYLEKAGKSLDEEQFKLGILQQYLPQLMSEKETKLAIEQVIKDLGITDLQAERGRLMWAIMGQYKGKIDGGLVNKILMSF